MAEVKAASAVAEKWGRVTPQRATDYQQGVQSPRTPWAQAAAAASDRYKAGVTEAAQKDRYRKGVAAAGDQKWQQKALAKGPSRFAEGVAISAPDYQAAIQPYLDVIKATQLPARFTKGDPRNIERVRVMAEALRKKKTG